MQIALVLAFLIGCLSVVSKMINYQATKHLGTTNGTLVNYITASIISFMVLLFTGALGKTFTALAAAPLWPHLGAVFGVIALIISLVAIDRMDVFTSTAIILTGQLAAGIILDCMIQGDFSLIKIAGVLLVAIGILIDKKMTFRQKNTAK